MASIPSRQSVLNPLDPLVEIVFDQLPVLDQKADRIPNRRLHCSRRCNAFRTERYRNAGDGKSEAA
jgi:hypothetical protein